MYVFQVALYNTDQEGSDSPRSSLNNSLSDQSLASVNLNSVGSVHSYTPVRPLFTGTHVYSNGVNFRGLNICQLLYSIWNWPVENPNFNMPK